MIFRVTLKNPDHWHDAVREAVTESVSDMTDVEERDACAEIREEKLWDFLEDFLDYREYITLECDSEKKTITVLKADQE